VDKDVEYPSMIYYSTEHYYGDVDPVWTISKDSVELDPSQYLAGFEDGKYFYIQIIDETLDTHQVRLHMTRATEDPTGWK
jgi:hypothetical protein